MVKVGFIVEGSCEKIMVESQNFCSFLKQKDYELVRPVIDAEGGGNLLPKNIDAYIKQLDGKNIEKIFVVTDLEDEESIEIVRQRIQHERIEFSFIAVKAIEAWFLADTEAMKSWLEEQQFYETEPEKTTDKPWDRLKEIASSLDKRGPGSKVTFAKKMIKYHNFCITKSALHPNCPSAKEFVDYFN
ncbi:hypothetical protein ACOW3S_001990 [Vibrio fluvialis]|nr:hypothetical protein [Vibrio fluvialis]EKO3528262.1 hypothetical protein [Vibrio fluvialis]